MRLEPLLRMHVELGQRYKIGDIPKGRRNVWTLSGGTVEGPRIRGNVAPVGGEFELIDKDGVYHIDVRMVIVTDDGANILVQYFGIANTPADVLERYRAGETVDFGDTYFCTQPRFETDHPRYFWMNHAMAITEGRGTADGVEYLMYHCIPDGSVGLANADAHFKYRGDADTAAVSVKGG